MKKTHQIILNELNKTYELNNTKESEDKIVLFVENELKNEISEIIYDYSTRRHVFKMAIITSFCACITILTTHFFSLPVSLIIPSVFFILAMIFFNPKIFREDYELLRNYFYIKALQMSQSEDNKNQELIYKYLEKNEELK